MQMAQQGSSHRKPACLQVSRQGSPTRAEATALKQEVAKLQQLNAELVSKLAFAESKIPGLAKCVSPEDCTGCISCIHARTLTCLTILMIKGACCDPYCVRRALGLDILAGDGSVHISAIKRSPAPAKGPKPDQTGTGAQAQPPGSGPSTPRHGSAAAAGLAVVPGLLVDDLLLSKAEEEEAAMRCCWLAHYWVRPDTAWWKRGGDVRGDALSAICVHLLLDAQSVNVQTWIRLQVLAEQLGICPDIASEKAAHWRSLAMPLDAFFECARAAALPYMAAKVLDHYQKVRQGKLKGGALHCGAKPVGATVVADVEAGVASEQLYTAACTHNAG